MKHWLIARSCLSHQSPFFLNSAATLELHMLHSFSGMPCSSHHQPLWADSDFSPLADSPLVFWATWTSPLGPAPVLPAFLPVSPQPPASSASGIIRARQRPARINRKAVIVPPQTWVILAGLV